MMVAISLWLTVREALKMGSETSPERYLEERGTPGEPRQTHSRNQRHKNDYYDCIEIK